MSYIKELKPALLLSLALFAVCGLAYPYALTGVGQVFMAEKAQGSLLEMNGHVIGSALVGQDFEDPRFLKGRPSAVGYNTYSAAEKAEGSYAGVASGSNNYAPSNPALVERITQDKQAFLEANPEIAGTSLPQNVPGDLLTASGSGLDPHISPAAAKVQLPAMARHTGLPMAELESIVAKHTTGKWLGIFGGESVHVLKVNRDIAQALGIRIESSAVKE